MAGLTVKHVFQSAKGDGVDATLVQPSNWNASHDLEMDTGNLLGRHTAGAGVVEQLTPATVESMIHSAIVTALGLGSLATKNTVATADITDAAVTLAKQANLAEATIIGRAIGAGAGVPTALTAAQVSAFAPALRGVQVFTAAGAGTYTATAGATRAIAILTGGGGGGGGSGSTDSAGAGGGGGGATAVVFISSLAATLAYTVGAAGAAGAAAAGTGGTGGQSVLGTATANGGLGGVGNNSTSGGSGVAGGAGSPTTTNATFSVAGSAGGFGFTSNSAGVGVDFSGYGGGSFWGMGGQPYFNGIGGAGRDGVAPGSGGSGALRSGSNVAGGAGAPGIIVVLEF